MAALDSGTLDQTKIPTVFDVKDSVHVATTANITLSGEKTIDGVSTSKSRVLVKDQTDASKNGIYVSKSGSWSRSEDANSNDKINASMYMWVESGTVNGDNGFVLTTDEPITLGVTNLTFTQFTGAGQLTAGAGLTKTGNTFDVVGTAGRISVAANSVDVGADIATADSTNTFTNKTINTSGNTITIAAADVSDFDTEVANNSAVTANTAKTSNVTHTGDVTGSGALTIASGAVDIGMLSATGTASSSTYLRGDNAWSTVDSSPLTTKGDVYTFDTGNARLGVGADGLVLKADSSTATGLAWGSGGGGATIVHTFSNTTTTTYTGTASSFGTVGVGDRDIYIKKIDANNEGVFTKIWKNGVAVEVQIA